MKAKPEVKEHCKRFARYLAGRYTTNNLRHVDLTVSTQIPENAVRYTSYATYQIVMDTEKHRMLYDKAMLEMILHSTSMFRLFQVGLPAIYSMRFASICSALPAVLLHAWYHYNATMITFYRPDSNISEKITTNT